jgi:hypothetical protein
MAEKEKQQKYKKKYNHNKILTNDLLISLFSGL